METYVMKIHAELAGSAEQVPDDKLGSEVRFAEAGWNIIFVGLPRRFGRLQSEKKITSLSVMVIHIIDISNPMTSSDHIFCT